MSIKNKKWKIDIDGSFDKPTVGVGWGISGSVETKDVEIKVFEKEKGEKKGDNHEGKK